MKHSNSKKRNKDLLFFSLDFLTDAGDSEAICKWHPYILVSLLLFKQIKEASSTFWSSESQTPAQARRLPKLLGYDYKIENRRGREDQGPNALSRLGEFQMTAITLPDWWKKLQAEVKEDFFMKILSTTVH